LHTLIVKYSSSGNVLWANYVNCPSLDEGDNIGTAISCSAVGEIVVAGTYTQNLDFFIAEDFDTVIKHITTHNRGISSQVMGVDYLDGYVAKYSSDGIPLWVSTMVCFPTASGPIVPCASIQIDSNGNVYTTGTSNGMDFYNPDGFLRFTSSALPSSSVIICRLNPDGTLSSFTRLNDLYTTLQAGSVLLGAISSELFVSSIVPYATAVNEVKAYQSLGVNLGVTESFNGLNQSAVVLNKYALSSTDSGALLSHTYNDPFEPLLLIGGGNRTLQGGFVADETAEPWGGQTGLPPSAISLADANAGVISYLGHEPGYSIPTVDGFPESSGAKYTHLVVQLSEPSFPTNDPQPVSPGSIPNGFLPIYLTFPSYATGAVFNSALNNATPLRLSATGTVSASGLFILGVVPGDVIRICAVTLTTSRYVTVQVKELISSNIVGNIQSAIVFEEPTRYLVRALGEAAVSSFVLMTSTKEVSAFFQPVLINQGQLNLILQLYPQFHP
jgi:hypothetical protein